MIKSYMRTTNSQHTGFKPFKAIATKVNGVVPDSPAQENYKKSTSTLSQFYYVPKAPTIITRRVAILMADGFNPADVQAVRLALASAKATNFTIGPCCNWMHPASQAIGERGGIVADHHSEGQQSTRFDVIFIPPGAEHAKPLGPNGRIDH